MNTREFVEKTMLAGIGVLSLTREKAKTVVDDLVKRGEVWRDEAQDWIDRLTARSEEERQALRKVVKDETEHVLSGLNLATSQDIEALGKRIEALGKQLEK
jgi:polyhydroxyalkanoate synthesis regulator phasin